MAYWNRYDDQEEDQNQRDRDFESGQYYNRGGFSRGRGDYDRTRQWRQGTGQSTGRENEWNSRRDAGRNSRGSRLGNARTFSDRDLNNLADDYDPFGEQYGENYPMWGTEDRDWDYGYARDYGQNRDVRRDYQSDRENDYRQNRRGPGSERARYSSDQYDRYNTSGYNPDEEYYGLGYRPTNYNPHHPGRMPGREIPVAGMQSDFGGDVDYDNPNSGRSNYGRGDLGYDSEGAFYQDMDEPVSHETSTGWQRGQNWQRNTGRRQERYRDQNDYRGEHAGKGPANYRRSDSRIQEDICERMTRHGQIDASDIDVSVDNGVAILKGSVPSREMKRMAEDVADDVTGVKDVENAIKVNRQRSWDQPNHDWNNRVEQSPAGQSNVGAGLTSAGATSLSGMEAADEVEENRHGLREGMEVIGRDGKLLGRVKELREGDFLLDRELARDLYVPYSALQSVGAQAMLNLAADEIDQQNWEKPSIL